MCSHCPWLLFLACIQTQICPCARIQPVAVHLMNYRSQPAAILSIYIYIYLFYLWLVNILDKMLPLEISRQ